jgi:hypothetical protein
MKLTTWVSEKYEDFVFWYTDKPFTKVWRGTKDRFDAVVFCLLLLVVGIYSPKALRQIMIDALRDTKKG